MKRFFVILFCILCCAKTSFAGEIAITFDDLPGREGETAAQQQNYNQKIISVLKRYGAPAIGFVNEARLAEGGETKAKTAILQAWLDAGFPLGNHTFSHLMLSETRLADYQADVMKGQVISKKMTQRAGFDYRYFRHPFLDIGTPQMHAEFSEFLAKHHYVIAPVTVDGWDWKFNQRMLVAPPEKQAEIVAEYIAFSRAKLIEAESNSQDKFGRNIRHVWLLHVNPLNAEAMERLLQMAQGFGYQFISLDRALEDPAYENVENPYSLFLE